MDSSPDNNHNQDETASLEGSTTSVESGSAATPAGSSPKNENSQAPLHGDASSGSPSDKPSSQHRFKQFLHTVNIYLLLFVLVILVAGIITTVGYLRSQKSNNSENINSQTLSQNTLEQLANSNAAVIGSSKQILNIQSDTVFAGKVLVRDSLAVAGNLQIGGALTLQGIKVTGSSVFNQAQVNKNFSVGGDEAVQGGLTVKGSLQVGGGGTFGGNVSASQLTTSSLQLNGTLNLTHHIAAGGATPSRSTGSAVGHGGSATVSGSDTAGSVAINTGSSPSAGCFITVYFNQAFNTTPHVVITPVGQRAGSLNYYINRSSSNFSICTANSAPSGKSFGFDYIVFD